MDKTIVFVVVTLINKVAEMVENWNNPEYVPPSADELRELARQLEELPDLPESLEE